MTHSVILDISGESNNFISEKQKLSIVFCNIISNAIKYQKSNSSDSFLKISINNYDTFAAISFTDNGIGISKSQVDKVFDMFTRCTENSTGSGLGMYIVKQTIEKLDGRINLESSLGKGTKIEMELPSYNERPYEKTA